MALIFVGSHAFNEHKPSGMRTQPNDLDIIADLDKCQNFMQNFGCISIFPFDEGKKMYGRTPNGFVVECEIAWPGSTGEELIKLNTEYGGAETPYPTLDLLYTLKMSHRFKKNSPHFLKTMNDIHTMRRMGAIIPEYLKDWYKRREKETYDYAHPNLNQNKDGFFADDGLTYIYDHDSLHEAVKLSDVPAYTLYQKDGSEVLCDKKKWDDLPEFRKRDAVYEEACVLALERSLIPHPGVKNEEEAFDMALMKVCTSITSGWFREFAWENYDSVRDMFTARASNLMDTFNYALEKGIVKKL